jgi:hypothetical protein
MTYNPHELQDITNETRSHKTKISILCMIVPFNFSREFVSMHETQLDSRILNFI